jgi:4-hydroxythreonine-4-phosphate dehydrogenase
VCNAISLLDRIMRAAQKKAPRIAVAGLNPHAGEGGLLGNEEIRVIQPAVARARAQGADVFGPYPADTLFIAARRGDFDAVVTMYHDQGQIAMKLMGFEKGVTLHGGLPKPVATPAHGTAFDIAGKGIANVGPMREAFRLAVRLSGSEQVS